MSLTQRKSRTNCAAFFIYSALGNTRCTVCVNSSNNPAIGSDLKEVKHADIIVAGNQAYVAVVLTNGNKGAVENNLKKKIAKKVRSTDKNIDNVYVSANPDFVERMQEYGKRIQTASSATSSFRSLLLSSLAGFR